MKFLFPVVFSFILWVFHSACSINFQDPQDELDEILYENSDWNLENLEGEWEAVSKFNSGKDETIPFTGIQFEILKDSSFSLKANSQELFPVIYSGTISWESENNVLIFKGENQDGEILELNLKGNFHFEGNYLDLFFNNSDDYIHFEKIPLQGSSELKNHLQWQEDSSSKLWEYIGYRLADNQKITQNYLGEIAYYSFKDEKLTVLKSLRGQIDSLGYDFTFNKDSLKISSKSRTEVYLVDYFHTTRGSYDSLRLWPVQSHNLLKLDSIQNSELDYILFHAVKKKHENYIELGFLTAHYWKADTITYLGKTGKNHFGQYYDMAFYPDGNLKIITNNPIWPVYQKWNVVNGKISLETDSGQIAVTPSLNASGLILRGTSFTAVLAEADSGAIAQDPLSRFPNQDYFHLFYNGDTLKYYFESKCAHHVNGPDSVQIYRKEADVNYPLGFASNPGNNTDKLFQNDKDGYFIFTKLQISSDSSVWVFSDSSLKFEEGTSIRSSLDTKSGMVTGTLTEGKLKDSNGQSYTVSGKFRYGTSISKPMDQNLWISSKK